MAKANKDGWIRHRGGKCPVEKGTLIDVRHRDGEIYEEREAGSLTCSDWTHTKSAGDILAYRICKPEQQKEAEVKETAKTLRARYLATFEEKKALEVTIAARQNDIAMIEKEQEELRGKVRALGFDFYDAPNVDKDMKDPKNWIAGDILTIKSNSNGHQFEIEENVLIDGHKNRDGEFQCWHLDKSDFWFVDSKDAKFHSRPK